MAHQPDPNAIVLLTEAEAAKQLRMSPRRLHTLRKAHKIGYIQDGSRIKYKPDQLDAYVEQLTIKPKEAY
jgi:excisionase family DNA binding protein